MVRQQSAATTSPSSLPHRHDGCRRNGRCRRVHRIQACTGPNFVLSVKIATWRSTTAATKATGTNLTETDEVLSFEAMLRAYNKETKPFQANDRSAGGRQFKPPFKAFSTDVREPCQWCLKNLNKTFLHKNQDCATRIDHLRLIRLMETREVGSHPSASSAKGKAIGRLYALRRPTFRP